MPQREEGEAPEVEAEDAEVEARFPSTAMMETVTMAEVEEEAEVREGRKLAWT